MFRFKVIFLKLFLYYSFIQFYCRGGCKVGVGKLSVNLTMITRGNTRGAPTLRKELSLDNRNRAIVSWNKLFCYWWKYGTLSIYKFDTKPLRSYLAIRLSSHNQEHLLTLPGKHRDSRVSIDDVLFDSQIKKQKTKNNLDMYHGKVCIHTSKLFRNKKWVSFYFCFTFHV